MKNWKKRLNSFVLCLSMSISLVTPAMAINDDEISDLWVSDIAALTEMTGVYSLQQNSGHESATLENSVQYDYTISKEDGETYVVLDFSIHVGNDSIDFTTTGYAESIPYGDNDVYYEGILEGIKIINGVEYTAVAGFQKLESSDNVKIGLVLTPKNDNASSLIMIFGDRVLSAEEMETFLENSTSPKVPAENNSTYIMPRAAEDDYTREISTNIGLNDEVSLTNAGKMEFYLSEDAYRGIHAVRSNCDGVAGVIGEQSEDYVYCLNAYVSNIYMRIDRISGRGYIAGFEDDIIFPDEGSQNIDKDFRNGIHDILEWFAGFSRYNIPVFFLDWISSSLEGRITTNGQTSYKSVNIEFGVLDKANFDDGYFPVTYQFDEGRGGKTSYECTANIDYRCYVHDIHDDSAVIILSTDTASDTFSLG